MEGTAAKNGTKEKTLQLCEFALTEEQEEAITTELFMQQSGDA
jgi:hypothetical protein